jgi:repressor LexA
MSPKGIYERKHQSRLSEKTWSVLEFIQRFQRDEGYPPTIREICKRFSFSSTNAIRHHLGRLIYHGYLTRSYRVARGLRVTKKAKVS